MTSNQAYDFLRNIARNPEYEKIAAECNAVADMIDSLVSAVNDLDESLDSVWLAMKRAREQQGVIYKEIRGYR